MDKARVKTILRVKKISRTALLVSSLWIRRMKRGT